MNTTNFYNLPIHVKEQILQNYLIGLENKSWDLKNRKIIYRKNIKYPDYEIKINNHTALNQIQHDLIYVFDFDFKIKLYVKDFIPLKYSQVTTLYLESEYIRILGAINIAQVLSYNVLTNLYLIHCRFVDKGLSIIIEALKTNKTIKYFDCSYTIFQEVIPLITEILKVNNTLEILNITGTYTFTEKIKNLLVEALNINSSLKKLHLSKYISPDDLSYLKEKTKNNSRLEIILS